mgnify:CR=1 FL=1|tara:strand:+ start:399 stop:698 length:300 start_codon:yes stop_codon:yes gene_type:complete
MSWDTITNKVPKSMGKVHKPRQLGLLIMALEQGPATVHQIQDRLRGKYRFYPDTRQASGMLNTFYKLFERVENETVEGQDGTYKIIKWKLRDDIYSEEE